MEKKICSKCKIEYSIENFHLRTPNGTFRSQCNFCLREYRNKKYKLNVEQEKLVSKLYREKNRDEILSKKKESYEINKDKILSKAKNYRQENPEKRKEIQRKYREKHRDIILLKSCEWRKNNPKYCSDRKKIDPVFKLSANMRSRIRIFLKKNSNIKKLNKTFDIIGCSPEFLKKYLENKFTEGMSWENYGLFGWHIDHIIPLSSCKNNDEVYTLCHYTNLQPLWSVDNIKKGNRMSI